MFFNPLVSPWFLSSSKLSFKKTFKWRKEKEKKKKIPSIIIAKHMQIFSFFSKILCLRRCFPCFPWVVFQRVGWYLVVFVIFFLAFFTWQQFSFPCLIHYLFHLFGRLGTRPLSRACFLQPDSALKNSVWAGPAYHPKIFDHQKVDFLSFF